MSTFRLAIGLMVLGHLTGHVKAADPQPTAAPSSPVIVLEMSELVRMGKQQLEDLYRQTTAISTPAGVTRGRAIFKPGSRITVPASQITRVLWQGKVFTEDGMMVNRVFGGRAIHAKVYLGESWLDGKPALILDYAGTSRLFPNVRDEVREVTPGLYLGITYLRRPTGPEQAMYFTLDARYSH